MEKPVLFYDGACKFCNYSVQYILRNEKEASFQFAHLQDPGVTDFLEKKNDAPISDSIYVLEDGKVFMYSDASIKIAKRLKWPYSMLQLTKLFPRFIRDWGYKIIAESRYKIAGRNETCIYPKELDGRLFKVANNIL